jgi:hypothetical protein
MIYNILSTNGIEYKPQHRVGKHINGSRHIVDIVVNNTLISLKYQQRRGSTEEKVPFECMKLQDAVNSYNYSAAIIVLAGDTGWRWKEYYLSPEFRQKMAILCPDVYIIEHREFQLHLNRIAYTFTLKA